MVGVCWLLGVIYLIVITSYLVSHIVPTGFLLKVFSLHVRRQLLTWYLFVFVRP